MSNAATATDVAGRGRPADARPGTAPGGREVQPAASEPPLRSSDTPRRLALLRALSVVLTLLFALTTAGVGYLAQAQAVRARQESAQYVRLATIKADVQQAQAIASDNVALTTPAADASTRYAAQLANAGGLIVEASAADSSQAATLATIDTAVITYGTQLEAALAAKRAGGTSDTTAGRDELATANATLTDTIAPQLDSLRSTTNTALTADAKGVSLWWILVPGVLALAALIVTAVQLALRTHRVFNLGVLLATLAVILAIWVAVSTISGLSTTTNQAMSNAFASTRAAAAARDDASLAHAAETQALLGSGSADAVTTYLTAGDADVADVSTNQTAVQNAWSAYKSAATTGQSALTQGSTTATEQIAGSGSGSSATTYLAFMSAADGALTQGQATTSEAFAGATTTLRLACLGVGLLALFAAVASSLGISRRLREYR